MFSWLYRQAKKPFSFFWVVTGGRIGKGKTGSPEYHRRLQICKQCEHQATVAPRETSLFDRFVFLVTGDWEPKRICLKCG